MRHSEACAIYIDAMAGYASKITQTTITTMKQADMVQV